MIKCLLCILLHKTSLHAPGRLASNNINVRINWRQCTVKLGKGSQKGYFLCIIINRSCPYLPLTLITDLIYRPFHETLPRSSAFVISVRFYETDCKPKGNSYFFGPQAISFLNQGLGICAYRASGWGRRITLETVKPFSLPFSMIKRSLT